MCVVKKPMCILISTGVFTNDSRSLTDAQRALNIGLPKWRPDGDKTTEKHVTTWHSLTTDQMEVYVVNLVGDRSRAQVGGIGPVHCSIHDAVQPTLMKFWLEL